MKYNKSIVNISLKNDAAMRKLGFRTVSAKNGYRPIESDERFERSPSNPEDYYKIYYPRQMEDLEPEQWEISEFPEDKTTIDQRQIRLGYKHGDVIRYIFRIRILKISILIQY